MPQQLEETSTPKNGNGAPRFHPINDSSDSSGAVSKKRKSTIAASQEDLYGRSQTPPSGKRLKSLQSSANSQSTLSQRSNEQNVSPDASTAPPAADAYQGPSPLILSSNSDVCTQEPYKKFLRKQRANTPEHLEQANFLCVGTADLKTTAKLLISLAMGKTVVTDEWVTDSHAKGYLLDPEVYLHKDLQGRPTDRTNVFKQREIYITAALKKQYGSAFSDIQLIMRHAGAATISAKLAKDIDAYNTAIIIGVDSNDKDVATLTTRGFKCYKKELMSISIIDGQLLVDDDSFIIKGSAATTPSTGRKKKAAK